MLNSSTQSLSHNDQIRQFNKEVHQFEDAQVAAIQNIWQQIDAELISANKLSQQKKQHLQEIFPQVFVNLNALMQAKTAYAAELYYRTLFTTLQSGLSPRGDLINLHSEILDLTEDEINENKIFEINSQLFSLKQKYHLEGIDCADKFDQAIMGLDRLFDHVIPSAARNLLQKHGDPSSQAPLDDVIGPIGGQSPIMLATQLKQAPPGNFKQTKSALLNSLSDINDLSMQQRKTDNFLNLALEHCKSLYVARTSYLEDHRDFTHKVLDTIENSWVATGVGLCVVPFVLGLAVPALSPVAAFGLGVAGAVYGTVDLVRTAASAINKETTIKLGKRELPKPEPTTMQRAQKLAKKVAPTVLCIFGAAVAVAAIVVTAGAAAIALGVAGLAVTAAGIGMMGYQKYQQRQKFKSVCEQHQTINKNFAEQPRNVDINSEKLQHDLSNEKKMTINPVINPPAEAEHYQDSIDEAVTLLTGHHLTAAGIKHMEVEYEKPEAADKKIAEPQYQNAVVPEPKSIPEVKPEEEDDGGEGEGRPILSL